MFCPGQVGFQVARRVEAEKAHKLAVWGLSKGLIAHQERVFPNLACKAAGLSLDNPLGLAAGKEPDELRSFSSCLTA